MLTRLRHRTVGRCDHKDRPVHLRGAGDHVLDVVGVARAVDVCVVAVVRLVFHVLNRDRDAARLLFRRVVDRGKLAEVRVPLQTEHFRDRCRQRRLPVVHVTNRSDVRVRLRPLKSLSCHLSLLRLFDAFALILYGALKRI